MIEDHHIGEIMGTSPSFVNLRLGHATNSSSSHSMIITESPLVEYDDISDGFGWGFFTAADPDSKQLYAASILFSSVSRIIGDDGANAVLRGLGLPQMTVDSYGCSEFNIDHQSQFCIPKTFDGKFTNLEFFEDLRKILMHPNLTILGGNDNTDEKHSLFNMGKEVQFDPYGPDRFFDIARKDGTFWTVYDRSSGNRFTFSFTGEDVNTFKPKAPMLVDVKLTDWCDAGCAFCYQGSTKNGEDADDNFVSSLPYQLAEAEVFEVAIGGGEPTKSKHFIPFITACKNNGVTPNFTTRSFDWLENDKQRTKIIESIGAFALSVHCQQDVERLATIGRYHNIPQDKMTVQVVPFTMSSYVLESILRSACRFGVRVTLLGFKDVGRGVAFKKNISRHGHTTDIAVVQLIERLHKEHACPRMSIDTALAVSIENELQSRGVPTWLYHKEEGKYSMYIDAVTKKFASSSYHQHTLKPCEHLSVEEMFAQTEVV